MEKRFSLLLNEYREELISRKEVLEKRRSAIKGRNEVVLIRKKASKDRWYYYAKERGTKKHQRYLGVGNTPEVNEIKEFRFIDKSIRVIEKNLKAVERIANKFYRTDYESINEMLPDTYRWAELAYGTSNIEKVKNWKEKAEAIKASSGVYRPEELKVWTDDGRKVRS